MNIEEAITSYSNIKPNKDLISRIDVDYFFEFAETLLTAYEKEKEKNSKAIAHIECCKTSLGNYILSPNETEYLLEILKEE